MAGRFVASIVLALVTSSIHSASGSALQYNVSLNSQVRTAYAGPYGITISWNTYYQLSEPTIYYGLSPLALDGIARSTNSTTYQTSLTYNNHVRISDLQPNTQYYYLPDHLINNTDLVGPFTFKTARLAGDVQPYSIAVVVDMGAMGSEGLTTTAGKGVSSTEILMPGEQNTIQSLTAELDTYEFLMQPGDFAYADTWLTEINGGFLDVSSDDGVKAYESILDVFYDQLTNVTARVPLMVGPGNHEANCLDYAADCAPGQSNFTGFINHFRMPSDISNQAPDNFGVGNMWYSFDYGMVHYVSLDMETDFPGNPDESWGNGPFGYDGEQVDWLTADLKAVNRSLTPWIIVTGHRQWYSSGDGPCTACQTAFEALFNKYAVDLYISGHYHVYERNVPVGLDGVIDPKGLNDPSSPWYIINGIAGHYAGLNPFNHASEYQAFGLSILNATYGWSRLTFHNRTHMTHEFIDSATNTALDTATLYKNHTFAVLQPNSSTTSSTANTKTTVLSSSLPTIKSTSSSSLSTKGINSTTTTAIPNNLPTTRSTSSTSSSTMARNSTTTTLPTNISKPSTAFTSTGSSTTSMATYTISTSPNTGGSHPTTSSFSLSSSPNTTATYSSLPSVISPTSSSVTIIPTTLSTSSGQGVSSSVSNLKASTAMTSTISSHSTATSQSTSAPSLNSITPSASAVLTSPISGLVSTSSLSCSSLHVTLTTSSHVGSGESSRTVAISSANSTPGMAATTSERTTLTPMGPNTAQTSSPSTYESYTLSSVTLVVPTSSVNLASEPQVSSLGNTSMSGTTTPGVSLSPILSVSQISTSLSVGSSSSSSNAISASTAVMTTSTATSSAVVSSTSPGYMSGTSLIRIPYKVLFGLVALVVCAVR